MDARTTSILKSMVSITQQKDIDSLEASIFQTISEMLPVNEIYLFKLKNNSIEESINFHPLC